ncbi:MAG: agmatinase [Clostridia bacterium]|jgi:agmatinase|nr:agmatinase [Clostridiales bacterium]MDK2985189.1 agmatinase [Clostridia bacterium]
MFIKSGTFLGSCEDFKTTKVALIGVPMDFTVSFRPGARSGPGRIREVSEVLEEYSPLRNRELSEVPFSDLGDLDLPWGNVEKSLGIIEKAANFCLKERKKPFFLGGEHLITWPIVKSIYKEYKDLKVIQFDAHADLREDYLGEKFSHATVMRQICNVIGPENVYQLGIRSGTKEEFAYGNEYTNFYPHKLLEVIEEVAESCAGYPVYLTIDIDVFDPAYAPGTGTPEPGGHTSREVIGALSCLKDLTLVGCDIVEVAPAHDTGDITSILAAKMVREILLTFF